MSDLEYGTAFLELQNMPDPKTMDVLDDIQEAIRKVGCYLDVKTINGKNHLYLSINYETAKNSRKAGRRKKLVTREHWRITCGDVRKMIEEKGSEAAAEELGVSRATLFRRLKDKEDNRRF